MAKNQVTIKDGNKKQTTIYVHHAILCERGETVTEWVETSHGRQQVTYTVDGEVKFDGIVFGVRQKPENATPQGQRNWLVSVGCDAEINPTDTIKITSVGSFMVDIPDWEFMQLASVQSGIVQFVASRPDLFPRK